MDTTDCDIIVIGGGPTGLTAALAGARRGRSVVLLDEGLDHTVGSRTIVLHAGSSRVLHELGCADAVVAEGLRACGIRLSTRRSDLIRNPMDGLPGRFHHAVFIAQHRTEAILRSAAEDAGVRIATGRLATLDQTGSSMRATLESGAVVSGQFAVAADGVHSTIRQAAGIGFPGSAPGTGQHILLADVTPVGDYDKEWGNGVLSGGVLMMIPLPDNVLRSIISVDPVDGIDDANLLRREFTARRPRHAGAKLDFSDIHWLSRFTFSHHLADTFLAGRVLLAGDAGHVHTPFGGQGMNPGIRDGLYAAEALDRAIAAADPGAPADAPLDAYAANRRAAAKTRHHDDQQDEPHNHGAAPGTPPAEHACASAVAHTDAAQADARTVWRHRPRAVRDDARRRSSSGYKCLAATRDVGDMRPLQGAQRHGPPRPTRRHRRVSLRTGKSCT